MSPRRRQTPSDLPPRVYGPDGKRRSFRYLPPDGKPINLGRDKAEALRRWAEIVSAPAASDREAESGTLLAVWQRYERDLLPRLAKATQASYRQHSKKLLGVFGRLPVASIGAGLGIEYLDRRGATSKIQANREFALLSTLLTKAVHWRLIPTNPLLGLRYKHPERARTRVISDDELRRAMDLAPKPWLRRLMWLAYLTGFRRADLLALTRFHCKADGIEILEQKTQRRGKRVLVPWNDELRRTVSDCLADSPDNRLFPITQSAVDNAWGDFQRELVVPAGMERFLLRDIRAKYAADLERAGGNATVALLHSSRQTTLAHYLRLPIERPALDPAQSCSETAKK